MPLFVNPFRRHNEANFPDVLVSLETTSRQFSSVSQDSNDTEKGINKSGGSCGDESPVDESPVDESLAIDRLRVEIDLDVATSGHDSVYDRTYYTARTDTAVQPTLPYSTVETAC